MSIDVILEYYEKYLYPNSNTIYKLLHKDGYDVSHRQVKEVIAEQIPYQLHKKQKKGIKSHMVAFRENQTMMCDLLDMSNYSRMNKGYHWILICIDVFTRKLYARPIKNKTGPVVTEAFRDVCKESGYPARLVSDNGSEFLNSGMQTLLKKHRVYHETNEP